MLSLSRPDEFRESHAPTEQRSASNHSTDGVRPNNVHFPQSRVLLGDELAGLFLPSFDPGDACDLLKLVSGRTLNLNARDRQSPSPPCHSEFLPNPPLYIPIIKG